MTSTPDRITEHHGHAELDGSVAPEPFPAVLALPCEVCRRPLSDHAHFEIHGHPSSRKLPIDADEAL